MSIITFRHLYTFVEETVHIKNNSSSLSESLQILFTDIGAGNAPTDNAGPTVVLEEIVHLFFIRESSLTCWIKTQNLNPNQILA